MYIGYWTLNKYYYIIIIIIITTRNVFDSIVNNFLFVIHRICQIITLFICLLQSIFFTKVETGDIHIFNCDWGKTTIEHKRQYQLQLDNKLTLKTIIYIVQTFCVIMRNIEHILMTCVTKLLNLVRK